MRNVQAKLVGLWRFGVDLEVVGISPPFAPIPDPANVPGDYYVAQDCCTGCEVPLLEAPELFDWNDNDRYVHCFVKKQPATPIEVEHMHSAILCQELECIRYRGTDRLVQLTLIELGAGAICDQLPADLQQLSNELAAARDREIRASRNVLQRLAIWWARLWERR